MKRYVAILIMCMLASSMYVLAQTSCEKMQQEVEKAFSAFINDSTRRSDYYLNATATAEKIIKECSLNPESKKNIQAKKSILSLYGWCLRGLVDYQGFKDVSTPLKIQFFESKIDSLKTIQDPDLQNAILYIEGFYYTHVARNYPLAISIFQKVLDQNRNWVSALNELGWVYQLDDKNDLGKQFAENSLRLNVGYAPAYVTLGYAYAYSKDFKKAFDNFRKALHIDPFLTSAYIALGWWSYKFEKFDSAATYYRIAVQLNPEFVTANFTLANAFKSASKYYVSVQDSASANFYADSAAWYYRKSLEINPYLPEIFYEAGELFESKKQSTKMDSSYRQAIKLDNSYLYMLGIVDHNAGKYESAIQTYKKSLTYNDDKWTRRNIAACYYSLGKYDSAIYYLNNALELDSTYANPHELLATIYSFELTKDPKKRIYHLEKAFKYYPDAYNAMRYFTYMSLEKINNKDDLGTLKLLKEGYKEGCETCLPLLNALKFENGYDGEEKDFDEAKEWYLEALKKDSTNFATIAYNRVFRFFETGKINVTDTNEITRYRSFFQSLNNIKSIPDSFNQYRKVAILDEALLKLTDNPNRKLQASTNYNQLCWFGLLSKDFATAKMAVEKGLQLKLPNVYLTGNEPHVLLFNGQEEEAKKKYLELKDQPFGDFSITGIKTFKDAFLADFNDFKRVNYDAKDLEKIERIKKILNK